jgi:predicted thioesterase
MRQIPLGAKGSFNLLVQPEHLANRFKDAILPPVLATPVMIMVIENAALNQGLSRSRRERGRYRG